MPRRATLPIPTNVRESFFVAIWDLALVGYFARTSIGGDRLFDRFGKGSLVARRHGLTILWMVAGAFRFNEVASLSVSDIDWSGGIVQKQRSKRGAAPLRVIDKQLIDATIAWRQRGSINSMLVLPSRHGTPLNIDVFNRDVMRPLGELFGCSLSSHSLRDTAAQELLAIAQATGLGIRAVQESLGHRNVGSTEVYLRKQQVRGMRLDLSTIGTHGSEGQT